LYEEQEEGKTMTVYEWKVTDLGNGEHGFIWISQDGEDSFGPIYRVFVDPRNDDAWLSKSLDGMDLNMVSNIMAGLECPEESNEYQHDASWYSRILFFWRRLGCPVLDRKAPGYTAPWFDWVAAGFTDEERVNNIAEPPQAMTEEFE
jgi:hypothetical protein